MSVPLHLGRRVLGQILGTRMMTGKSTLSSAQMSPNSILTPLSAHQLGFHGCWTVGSSFHRSFSQTPRNDQVPTDLMDYPRLVPTLFSAAMGFLRNRFFELYIINRYDADFSVEEFKKGAKAAFLVVSDILASDDLTPLIDNELVASNAYAEIKANHALMDSSRRRRFSVTEKEIRFDHLHQIGIIEDDDTGRKAVEIMMVYTVLDLNLLSNTSVTPKELIDNVMLCNYRFYRDYTNKDSPSSWILNVVNQF